MESHHTPKYHKNCRDSNDSSYNESKQCTKELKEPWLKARYLAVFMGFMGDFFLYLHRITMSVSIVAMVNSSTVSSEIDLPAGKSCLNLIEENVSQEMSEYIKGEFLWSPEIQGYILGSSFICFIIAVPFFSQLAQTYGGKKIAFICMFFPSLFTILSPFAARWNVYALIVVQMLRGICQGGVIPAKAILIANWCPKQERGYSYTITTSGSAVGTVLESYLSGVFCESELLGGWPSAFYINGSLGIIFSIIIWLFLYDNPSVHPRISTIELQYIIKNQENVLTEKRPKTPWKSLLTSVPIYALAYAQFGENWAMTHFLSVNPTFLKTVLHYSVKQNGLFNALPFLLQIFVSHIGGIFSTMFISRKWITVDKARKFCTLSSTFGYSLCVLGIYFAGCNSTLVIILSIAALSCIGFCFSGSWVTPTDMSPTFAGSIYAITGSIGGLAQFLLPLLVGYITNDSQTIEQWQKVFLICITIVSSSGLVFAVFGSAEIQTWNDVSDESQDMKKGEDTQNMQY